MFVDRRECSHARRKRGFAHLAQLQFQASCYPQHSKRSSKCDAVVNSRQNYGSRCALMKMVGHLLTRVQLSLDCCFMEISYLNEMMGQRWEGGRRLRFITVPIDYTYTQTSFLLVCVLRTPLP